MHDGPKVKANPLRIFVILLVISFVLGEIINAYLRLPTLINVIGLFSLIIFFLLFFISARMFFLYKEQLAPSTYTFRIIKTGVYSYTRNPIYLAFVGFQLSMFLMFGNIFYLLSSAFLLLWINFFVIIPEEMYLSEKFGEEYKRYQKNVSRWIFF